MPTSGDSASSARRAAGLLVVLVCVVLVAAVSGSSAESVPALVVQQGGQLYGIAVDGSRRVRLTKTPVRGSETAVSPDGSTVAFARQVGGISTMRLDGSDRRIVTRGADGSPAWSSDGQTIYFVRYRPNAVGDSCGSIFSVSASGGGVRRITNSRGHSHEDPAVSPDGARIAFSDWDKCAGGTADPRLRVVDPSGRKTGDLGRLPRNGYYPAPEHSSPVWSPDGTRLAYRWNADLAVANRDGSGQRRLTRGNHFIYEPPAWSPDGSWIAFTRYGPASVVIVVHPDGTGLRRLGRTSKGEYTLAGWLPSLPS